MPITLLTASILGAIFIILSIRVVRHRAGGAISIGANKDHLTRDEDPASQPLLVDMRTHANFSEYVPICLILMGLLEQQGFAPYVMYALGGTLIAARLMHIIGMPMKAPNPFRAGGVILTWLALAVMSGLGLWCVVPKLFLAAE